jgi:hypothetical protein
MQAVWTGMHALLVGVGVTLLGLLGAPTEAWLGAGTGMFALAAALICNAIYAHALQGQPRSDERATGDRRRAVMMLIGPPPFSWTRVDLMQFR